MVKLENHLGSIEISDQYFANLVGNATQSCYGVAQMVGHGAVQGLRGLFSKKNYPTKGVRVRGNTDSLLIDLHIMVIYGMNISAIVKSIVNKVRYTVEEATGLSVKKVNVFVDGMKSE